MKNIRSLLLLFIANSISGFASGITFIAIPWYLVSYKGEEDGKFINTLLVFVITFISLFWGTYAGALIDRYNRKRIFQVTQMMDVILLAIGVIVGLMMGKMPILMMAIVFAGTIFTFNIHYPNLYAFIQELFEPKYYRKVNSAIEIQHQITSFIGMGVGGILISGSEAMTWWPKALAIQRWDLWEIFALDGCTYLVSFLIISLIIYQPDPNRKIDTGPVLQRIKLGFDYLKMNKPLFIFGVASYAIFITLLVLIQTVMPIYINDYMELGSIRGGGVMAESEMAYSAGAIVAGLIAGTLSVYMAKTNLIKQIIFLLLCASLIYFVWAFTSSVWLFMLGCFSIGIANSGTRILRITYIIRIVPNHMVGRANSIFQIVNVMIRTIFVGLLMIPFFTGVENGANIVWAVGMMGTMTFIAAILLIINFSTFETKAAYG